MSKFSVEAADRNNLLSGETKIKKQSYTAKNNTTGQPAPSLQPGDTVQFKIMYDGQFWNPAYLQGVEDNFIPITIFKKNVNQFQDQYLELNITYRTQ